MPLLACYDVDNFLIIIFTKIAFRRFVQRFSIRTLPLLFCVPVFGQKTNNQKNLIVAIKKYVGFSFFKGLKGLQPVNKSLCSENLNCSHNRHL